MQQYKITGMSCAACSNRIEKAVSKVPGVTSCAVSLLTNSMGVEGSARPEDIISAVKKAGYGASQGSDFLGLDGEKKKLRRRLIASVIVLLILMYFSMGHMMFGFPVPKMLSGHVAQGAIQMILSLAILIINGKFFTSGFRSLFHGAPNMDTLVALGSGTAFCYSTYLLYKIIAASKSANMMIMGSAMSNLYFESAAMIPTLITIGKLLEAISKGRTTNALKGLIDLAPQTATVRRNGREVEMPVYKLVVGDEFVIKPGDRIPVDGVVVKGDSTIDESVLTGESLPVDKVVGSTVYSGTLNQSGYMYCKATRVGADTSLSQVIRLVSDAASTKAPLARIADKVSAVFVPVVIVLAIITIVGWELVGQSLSFAMARGITVLVISCPCALGLATPVAIMVGNGVAAKKGILYKTAEALETMGRIDVAVIDKTGTITKGEPHVTDIIPMGGEANSRMEAEVDLLALAYSLEKRSEHPLGKAIVKYCENSMVAGIGQFGMDPLHKYELMHFENMPGNGVRGKAIIADEVTEVFGGNQNFMESRLVVPDDVKERVGMLADEGKTPLFFARDNVLKGVIAVADVVKEDSKQAMEEIVNMGVATVMLTGDNLKTSKTIAKEVGMDSVVAQVLPADKEKVIRAMSQREGLKVAMIGDGINDAPALTRAEVGVAIGAGTDVALDAADVVLTKNSLMDVPKAIRLSRATIRNIHQNLFWAFIYNIICIPLAMGVYGFAMKPVYGAIAMSLSSLCVCLNALRLNRFDPEDKSHDKAKDEVDFATKKKKIQSLSEKLQAIVYESRKAESQMAYVPTGKEEHIITETQTPIRTSIKKETKNDEETVLKLPSMKDIEKINSDSIDSLGCSYNSESIGERNMTKTINIEGMSCKHCEANVKDALEALEGVSSADVSHESGRAVVEFSVEVDDAILKNAVEDRDYKVISIE